MRVKRKSAKTKRIDYLEKKNLESQQNTQFDVPIEAENSPQPKDSFSFDASNAPVFGHNYPISTSQVAGPSNAGPVLVGVTENLDLHISQNSNSSSCEGHGPPRVHKRPISSSQIAGPSTAGPVIIGGRMSQELHPYNSDSDTVLYSPPISPPIQVRPIEICAASENYPSQWLAIGKAFDRIMSNIEWKGCESCDQKFPDLHLRLVPESNISSCNICLNKSSRGLFTNDNEMDPGPVPEVLSDLTPIEEMLIAKIHPVVCLYRIRGQQMSYSGHVIHFKQDIVNLYNKLPVNPASSQAMVMISRATPSGAANLRIRSGKVRNALLYLKANHDYYRDIIIDEDVLASLPIDGEIEVPTIESVTDDPNDHEELDNVIYECNFPSIPQLDQATAISATLSSNIEWPVLQNTPISEFTTDGYLSQAFPTLFPRGKADLRQHRARKIGFLQYFQYLMRYHDGRFAKHPRFRFVAFDSVMRWQAIKQGNLFVQRNTFGNVTSEELKIMLENNPNLLSKVMFNVGKIRASQSFWSQRCGELLDMVQQIGTPTIFFTLSAADYHWPDLFRLLAPDVDANQLSERERINMMHDNPLITSWFFRRRAETFIDKVLKKIYPINDWWYRYEWQWRGSPHIHGVLWFDGAPDISRLDAMRENERERIAGYFANFCSAWNFDSNVAPFSTHPSRFRFSEKINDEGDLNSLLNCLQRHTRCGRHCLREERISKVLKCRYGFPKPIRENDALVKENDNWQFQPKRNDDKMARYNAYVTQVWRGNTDFSPITSKEAVLNYIARYATKCEKASVVHKKTLLDLASNSENVLAKTLISKLMISSTAERDFSAQELCHLLMSWPLYHSSRPVVNLVIRDDAWVNLLHTDSDKSAIIERYINRPSNMDSLSLYNFAALYRYVTGTFQLRKQRAIVRIFPRLKLGSTVSESEKYYKLLATVYLSWRTSPESLIENSRSITPWASICENLPNETPEDIRLDFPLPDDLFEEEIPEDPQREQRDPMQAISRAIPVEHEIRGLGTREIDEEFDWQVGAVSEDEKKRINSWLEDAKQSFQINLNSIRQAATFSADQSRVIELCRRQIRAINENALIRVKRTMVQGKAGSGKSFLIEQIANEFKTNLDEDSVAILAPTGVAAVNINGKTIHSYLKISVSEFKRLQGEALRKFQLKMQKIKVLIFDEMSMIGLSLLEKISIRLQEGSGSCAEPFGGYIIYFFGDMQQLPPVRDSAWYSETEKALGSKGKLLANTIERYYLLTTCHRQAGDDQREFRELLDGIAIGNISNRMYNLLIGRRCAALSAAEVDSFKDAIHIYPTKERVQNHNNEHLRKTGNPVAKIPAHHNVPQGSKASEDQAQGLVNELYLSVGCKVMLRTNLWTECGLVNGSIGIVREIRYKVGERPTALPVAIMVEFEKYRGPHYNGQCVPITPLKRHWKVGEVKITRTQFPLVVAHAITAHKSQGLTLDRAVVDIGENERTLGLSYVALSRVKTLDGLMLENSFEKSRIDSISRSNMMAFRSKYMQKFV